MSGLYEIDVFMTSGFVFCCCHGNIDFSKILLIPISSQFNEGKFTKKLFKDLRYGPEKTVSKHLKATELDEDSTVLILNLDLHAKGPFLF